MANEAKKNFVEEIPFATYGDKEVPIRESDIAQVARVIGFARKHIGLSESESFHYAMATFVLLQTGTDEDKATAEITAQNALSWEWENRDSLENLMDHQLECRLIFQKHIWSGRI